MSTKTYIMSTGSKHYKVSGVPGEAKASWDPKSEQVRIWSEAEGLIYMRKAVLEFHLSTLTEEVSDGKAEWANELNPFS